MNLDYPCHSHVVVLCDDGKWRNGYVIKREVVEAIAEDEPCETTWYVSTDAPRNSKYRNWISSDPDAIAPKGGKKYTVILFHNDGNNTTWMDAVSANNPEDAVNKARKTWATEYYKGLDMKMEEGETIDDLIADLSDEYTCIACIPGEHNDVKPN